MKFIFTGAGKMVSGSKFWKFWLPVIIWICLIFWMSTGTFASDNTASFVKPILLSLVPEISSQQLDLVHAVIRKAGHLTEYFILSLLLFRAFRGGAVTPWKLNWSLSASIIAVLWAACDEFHQSFVPTRTASIGDVGIDGAGGIIAQCLIALWYRYGKRRRHK